MTEPDREDVGGPVVAQPPIISIGTAPPAMGTHAGTFIFGSHLRLRPPRHDHGSGVAISF
jgi:hypothetical protein